MNRNTLKISRDKIQWTSILGARPSLDKYGLPWLKIRSNKPSANNDSVNYTKTQTVKPGLENLPLINSGPVGEARLDDQSR